MTEPATTQAEESRSEDGLLPPYVPWKAFMGFLRRWKAGGPPHKVDATTLPSSMDGSTRRKLRSTLKFLGLTDQEGVATEAFGDLVDALDTTRWKETVQRRILPAYSEIIKDLPLENGTAGQLDGCFRTKGKVEGQMLRKAVRFYLQALTEAGVKFSTLFVQRREGSAKGKRRNGEQTADSRPATEKRQAEKKGRASEPGTNATRATPPPEGMIDIPIQVPNKPRGTIRIHEDFNSADIAMITAILEAYAKRWTEGT